ncbi:MAG: hypothetical protein U0R23_11470 [Candidatus Nanopelagicales bacterium]
MSTLTAAPPIVTGAHRPTVRWIVGLFAASILLQRFALPGGIVPVLVVVVFAAAGYGLHTGLLAFDRRRLSLYLLAAGLTAAAALPQTLLVTSPLISLTSWGLFMTVWAPATLHLTHRDRATLHRTFEGCLRWGLGLAVVAIVMRLVQMVGLPYADPLAVVPKTLLVQGYVITYPIEYGSQIYRSNAWIGLEPSIISLQIGIAAVLAILLRANPLALVLLAIGIICTVSGSGVFIVAVALTVMLLMPLRRHVWPYVAAGAVTVFLAVQTPAGRELASRATEAAMAGSSTSLRAIEPYRFLWPTWSENVWTVLFGGGAGSSQQLVEATNRAGLLVPSPVKVFFDYGVIAGLALCVFLVFCYFGAPSRALAVTLFASSWVLQPGTTTFVVVMQTLLFVTWWAPRRRHPLESAPYTKNERSPLLEVSR